MIPITDPRLLARWSPMWLFGHHLTRPWWRRGQWNTWVRVDGKTVDDGATRRIGRVTQHDPARARPAAEVEAEIAAIDAAHPLPRPPWMPAQVWTWLGDDGKIHEASVGAVYEAYKEWHLEGSSIPRRAILVAGPGPWGRDVPWSPAATVSQP